MPVGKVRPGPRYEALLELLRTAESLWNASRVFFAAWDLSPSQFNVLNVLHQQRDGRTQGPYRGHVMKSSAYTRAVLSDVTRALPLLAAGVVFAAGARKFRGAA